MQETYRCYWKEGKTLRRADVSNVQDHCGAIQAVKDAYGQKLVVLAVVK